MILSLILDYTNQKTKKKLIKIKEHPNYSLNKTKILDKILSKFFSLLSVFFKNQIILSNIGVTFLQNIKVNLFLRQVPLILLEPEYEKRK